MNNDIMVSVLCAAYNHEKYIRKCLDGFVMQKTNFKFEVIINDDASTDKTSDIIREYTEKYPDIIKPIYQLENQYSKGVKMTKDILFPKARGKYVAICEGDDYWCSDLKLQKQFDLLENNTNSNFCLHIVKGIKANNEEYVNITPDKDRLKPEFRNKLNKVMSKTDFLDIATDTCNFRTSSFFIRSSTFKKYVINPPEFVKNCPIGDVPMILFFGVSGDVCFVDEVLSCYRMFADGSWTSKEKVNKEFRIKHYRKMAKMVEEFAEYTNYQYDKYYEILYRRWYNILWAFGDFEEILKGPYRKKYKCFFKKEIWKDRLYIKLKTYCPFFDVLLGIYKKIKHQG